MRIDLHTHSTRSDGTVPPGELVAAAQATGLDVVALTDHDTTAGWDEAHTVARRLGVELVPGIEVSTRYGGRSVHLLAYWPDPDDEALTAELVRVRAGREDRLPRMVAGLREHGVDITEEDVRRQVGPGGVLGRPHVADALVAAGAVGSRDEAFAGVLGPGGPGFVRRYAPELPDAVRMVQRAGGVAVLAHPWARGSASVLTPEVIAGLGVDGLEVDHQDHTSDVRRELARLAEDLGLVRTGSSDFHGTGKVDHELGCHTTDAAQLERLRALAESRGRAA